MTAADGELSYAELASRAEQLAYALRRRGVRRGSVVGVCLRREPDLVVSLLAVLRAGAAYLPVDPDHPPARIQHLVCDAGAVLVITHPEYADRLGGVVPHLLTEAVADATADDDDAVPDNSTPDDLAYVIYTSGSTGNPKGVMIPHRGIVNRLTWMQHRYRLTPA
ncbi:MAG: AMP-binding protein, partial [Micromonosporaceae bacterium]